MLTREEDIDAHALHRQGWTISAIARHLGRDRKTIRAYLRAPDSRGPGPAGGGPLRAVRRVLRARLAEDPHLWATTLFDELTAGLRAVVPDVDPPDPGPGPAAGLRAVPSGEGPPGGDHRPPARARDPVGLGRAARPAGALGLGQQAHLLVGALAHSGQWRGGLAASMDQPHLVDGLDRVARALGGLTRAWRFDRMATVVHPASGRVTASFAAVAKHYGVSVRSCPPRRGNRKGVVEKANHAAAQRFWRTLPDDVTVEQAQALARRVVRAAGDARLRAAADGMATVATLAAASRCARCRRRRSRRPCRSPRTVSAQALVALPREPYSVPPELARAR